MMLRKAAWAIGIVFLISHCAASQEPGPVEKIPLPSQQGMRMDGPIANEAIVFPTEGRGRASLVYAEADYLAWWVNRVSSPPLLTTAPNNGLNANGLTGGIIGQPFTRVLFTGGDIDFGTFQGARAKMGVALDSEGFWFLELGGFLLRQRNFDFNQAGNADGTPLLTIPFLDAATGQLSALDITAQDLTGAPFLSGSFNVHAELQVWGYELNMVAHSIRTAERNVDLMVGYRTASLKENLTLRQTVVPAQNGNITIQFPDVGMGSSFFNSVTAGSPVNVLDSFETRNRFHGANFGARFAWNSGPWSADLTGKVAFGVTHQSASISGVSTAAAATDPNTGLPVFNLVTPGGTFALRNNSGDFNQNQFTIVPEIGLNVNYAVTSWCQIRAGYTGMYWSNVARPGAQIDPVLNSKLVPTGALLPTPDPNNPGTVGNFLQGREQGRPFFNFRDTAFIAHGISVGVEFRY